MDYRYTSLIVILPLVVFLVLALTGKRMKPQVAGLTGTAGLLIITFLSCVTAYLYFGDQPGDAGFTPVIPLNLLWLRFTGELHVHLGILIDPLSVMMLVVITTVSLMVHVYSLGYMKGEKGFQRYYAFLSLFTFSMLGLVVATNIFQMYIFWELVGVSSYLLIGFYYERPAAVAAAKKAFIVTRFADLGFLVGILILSFNSGTFDFVTITSLDGPVIARDTGATFMGVSAVTWAMLFIFMGGAGKSAMFPLHIWLPDAMEGPTPVSALIHAATMVVAGVYLVARLFPAFAFPAPDVLTVIMVVGTFTSLFAAIIACTQTDIKRVLAFSTLSQIGYMMVALGVSGYGGEQGLGYSASLFHLFTHAFFKALLFLGAGSVIHAVHSNLMTDMGGLRKYMPVTHITFLIACLTIAGIPPLSGFFSKDEILAAAFAHNKVVFAVQWLVAGITAFYMFRLYFNIFWNRTPAYVRTPHESPKVMTIPLIILSGASVLAGFVPFSALVTSDGHPLHTALHLSIAIPSVLVALAGAVIAALLYYRENAWQTVPSFFRGFYTAASRRFYVDEVYLFLTHKVIFRYVSRPVAWFDRHIVDETMNLVGAATVGLSRAVRKMQSGQMQLYILVFTSGALLLALMMIYFK